jgi:hypothetical protein
MLATATLALGVLLLLCTTLVTTSSAAPAAAAPIAVDNDANVPLPTIYWRIRLQNSSNTTFGVPTISNGIAAVYAIDVNAQSTQLCVLDITAGKMAPTLLWSLKVPFVEEASGWIAAGYTGVKQTGVLALFAVIRLYHLRLSLCSHSSSIHVVASMTHRVPCPP